jgi:hypothetical protein
MPDVVGLAVDLVDTANGDLIARGSSRTYGGTIQISHEMPDRLLPQASQDALQNIYSWKS